MESDPAPAGLSYPRGGQPGLGKARSHRLLNTGGRPQRVNHFHDRVHAHRLLVDWAQDETWRDSIGAPGPSLSHRLPTLGRVALIWPARKQTDRLASADNP